MKYSFFIVWIVFFVTNKLPGQFNYNLSECIAIALENKKTIQSSKYDLESAKKSVLVSRGDFLPSLSFTYNNIQNKFSE